MSGVSLMGLPTMSSGIMDKLTRFQEAHAALPQIEVQTEHVLHGGVYVRTIRLAAETVLVGALVKIPTTLIVSGRTKVFTGEEWIELSGYHVIPARAGRKQIFVTQEETSITMIFRTDATTVEQAEEEFTDEYESLMSRKKAAGALSELTPPDSDAESVMEHDGNFTHRPPADNQILAPTTGEA